MFRLLKLATYALLGYALYEFFVGLTAEAQGEPRGQDQGEAQAREPGQSGQGRQTGRRQRAGQQLTGEGKGKSVQTQDPNGGAVPHVVGRGIVH
ncbi:MAG: hypothetical protein JWO87_1130 [Phycisphaerales bacterium]|jgi:hypothetical protein|nr:hypothetical protein [Phycisphaerales bacterium]MDB5299467.1 hypothetical protein [Phycisphaerales bacterium]